MNVDNILASASGYLWHAVRLTRQEQEFRQAFKSWLPKQIFDFHSHFGLFASVGEVPEHILRTMKSTFLNASVLMHKAVKGLFFPETDVRQVVFALRIQMGPLPIWRRKMTRTPLSVRDWPVT